ncbi:MAG: PocR ligand-binding domain-containing protein [Streptococcaceae bacterium]|nr:PocR ligand-binding domain-containing protein [Streptococcaceae bacterium]
MGEFKENSLAIWEEMQSELVKLTGLSIYIVSNTLQYFYSKEVCNKFCREVFNHKSLENLWKDEESYAIKRIRHGKSKYPYIGAFGLAKIAFPIIINEQHQATLFVGVVRLKECDKMFWDKNKFSDAGLYYIQENTALKNLYLKIPIFTTEEIRKLLKILKIFSSQIVPKLLDERLLNHSKKSSSFKNNLDDLETTKEVIFRISIRLKLETKKYYTLEDLSEEFNLSKYYISNLFKEYFGMSFKKYYTKIKIDHSLPLLKNSKLNNSQIAFAIGFKNTNYFYTLFKKTMHCTPTEFRKTITYS